MLKVGLIGCGGVGAIHAACWLALKDKVTLTAVADSFAEKAQKYADLSGARVYTDGYKLLENEDLDIVDICVPTFLHADYVIRASKTVKNIMVEKPVCLHEHEAKQLLEAQSQTGARIQVGHVVRFCAPYKYLKELVLSQQYGAVVAGQFSRISPRPMWMKGHDDLNRTGSMGLDMHIHDADYIRYLMEGEPDKLNTWGTRDENGSVQHIWSAYRYDSTLLVAEASWDYPVNLPFAATYRVKLERAAVVLDAQGTVTVYPDEGEPFIPALEPPMIKDMGINVSDMRPYYNEISYFTEAILHNSPDGIASLSEALASFRLVRKELELIGCQ